MLGGIKMSQFDIAYCIVFFVFAIICIPLTVLVMLPVLFGYFCGNSIPVCKTIEDGNFILFIGSISFCVMILIIGSYLDGVV